MRIPTSATVPPSTLGSLSPRSRPSSFVPCTVSVPRSSVELSQQPLLRGIWLQFGGLTPLGFWRALLPLALFPLLRFCLRDALPLLLHPPLEPFRDQELLDEPS